MSSPDESDVRNAGTFHTAYSTSHLRRNRTAENLVGPGRTLGRFYDWAGNLVERGIARASRPAHINHDEQVSLSMGASSSALQPYVPNTFVNDSNQTHSPTASIFESESESAEELRTFVERNATHHNLAGPGRLLGLLYDRVGKSLEQRAQTA